MSFFDLGKSKLPNGKPNIKWTEENLINWAFGFADSELEVKNISKAMMIYMMYIKNRNKEYLSAIDMELNTVCNNTL